MHKSLFARKRFAISALIGILAFFIVLVFASFNPFQEKIEIAVVSPLSNVDPIKLEIGQNNVDAINLYLKSVNKAGGINGKKVVLSVYDDQGNPEVASKVADRIVRSQAVALLGHTTSALTLAGSKSYQEYNMPVISGSAVIDDLTNYKWFFRTVFSNQEQATLMANYANKVMKYPKMTLIYGDTAYGKNFGENLSIRFQELGGEIVNTWIIGDNFAEDIKRDVISGLKSSIEAGKDPGILMVAMVYDKSIELIRQLKLANLNLPMFGGDNLSSLDIGNIFANEPSEIKDKGHFTKGVLTFTPIVFDVLDDTGQKFKFDFEKTYGREPGWSATTFYDAAVGVVEALKSRDLKGKNINQMRSLVIEGLNKFNSPATAFQGAGRLVYFDENGDTLTPAYIGAYDRNQLVSAFTQLQLIPNPSLISDLSKKILIGDILHIGDRYLQKTGIVYVGMDINGLDDIDEAKSSYLVDFYLWFRYQGNFPADTIEFTDYSTENLGSGEKLTLNKPIEEGTEDGINYKVYRMKAKFSENFDFRVYPFDSQTLKVKFRHADLTRDRLIYVKDIVGMRGAKSEKIVERARRTGVFDSISNWSVEKIEFFQNTLLNNSTLGKRKLIESESDIGYSQFNVNIVIDRDVRSFVIKNLLPLLFFIIIAYLLTFLPLENISIEAVSGLLLAVVFYHLNLTDKLPKNVGYTVLLDYAFYTVYFLLGLQLLTIVLSHSNAIKSHGITASQLMQWNRIAFPSIIVLTSISLLWVVHRSTI